MWNGEDPGRLLEEARRALNLTQKQLARRCGASERSLQRYAAGAAPPPPQILAGLARELAAAGSPALAARLRAAVDVANRELAALGIHVAAGAVEQPAAVPPKPKAAPPDATHVHAALVDSVVCAGADAAGVAPRVMREALRASLRRASELGVSPADLERALGDGRETPRS